MDTCAYCGTEIQEYYCSFCEMELSDENVLQNGERKDHTISNIPFEYDFNKSTPDLMKMKTIELLYLLKFARRDRSLIYNTRIMGHQTKSDDLLDYTFTEYEKITRKVWVIENIIKNRVGYFPKKISDEFLNLYLARIEESQKKKMTIKTKETVPVN